MKALILILTFFLTFVTGFSQNENNCIPFKKNIVFIEKFMGTGSYILNYDRLLIRAREFKIAACAGYTVISNKEKIKVLPVELSMVISHAGSHHIEIGTGLIYMKGWEKKYVISDFTGHFDYVSESMYASFRVGYWYQRLNGRLFLRAGIVPIMSICEF